MKVILVNGSPHEKGCTYTALAEVASALEHREGPRGRSAYCGNGLSVQCVRLRWEINRLDTCFTALL